MNNKFIASVKLTNDYLLCKGKYRVSNKRIDSDYILHWHEYFELELILSGKAYHILNGKTYELTKGSAFILSPSDFHEYIIPKGEEIIINNISFSYDMVSSKIWSLIETKHWPISIFLKGEELRNLEYTFNILMNEYNKDDSNDDIVKSCIEWLIVCFYLNTNIGSLKNEDTTEISIQPVLAYIQSNFRNKLTLSDAANVMHLSPRYFSRS